MRRTSVIVIGWLAAMACGVAGRDVPAADKRVEELIGKMTLEEKASLLVSWPPAIPRVGIPKYVWDNEGKHAFVSCFPTPIGIAATWDPEFSRKVAVAISDEARAAYNRAVREGGELRHLCFWAPTINMARDPRWGRLTESYGEDPRLTAAHAAAFIEGMQGADPRHLKAAAGVNHYAVYSEERDRHTVDAMVADERVMRDYYLPHFEAAIRAGAAAVGATNNGVNGLPACINRYLLTNILRQEWGFKGFVFSDSASVEDVWLRRSQAPDGVHTSALTIRAGCEINTGLANTHGKYLPAAVRQGLLPESAVDEALRRVLAVKFRLGVFDPPDEVAYSRIDDSVVDGPAHRQLALECARQSLVLLKNEGDVLPLDPHKLRRLVVAGPRADQPELGRKQTGRSKRNVSALDGLQAYGAKHGFEVVYEKETGAAVRAARDADAVVFLISLMEGEISDRLDLELPAAQESQLLELCATGKPVVLVLIGGPCVEMDAWEHRIPAMIAAWYPGMEGGNALADVIFGTVNPGGRLPVTIYRGARQLPGFSEFDITRGLTYQYCREPARFAFGHGLSYTKFAYSALQIEPDPAKPAAVTVRATVTNTGRRAGHEVAQLYFHAAKRGSGLQPLQQLCGFRKVSLDPGESGVVEWRLGPEHFAFTDRDLRRLVEAGPIELRLGGASDKIALRGSFEVKERVILRRGPMLESGQPTATATELRPDEAFDIIYQVENRGDTTGKPRITVDGEPVEADTPHVGPGEKLDVRTTLRLHVPGERRVSISGSKPLVVRVLPGPAKLEVASISAPPVALAGREVPLTVRVRNAGGEAAAGSLPLEVAGRQLAVDAATLQPGGTADVILRTSFDRRGRQAVRAANGAAAALEVGSTPDAALRTFANAGVGVFGQSGPRDFFIRATGSVGGSWVKDNNGADTLRDEYAAIYQPGAALEQCVIRVKVRSLENISNHSKAGLMVRRAIDSPGAGPVCLLHTVTPYFHGIGSLEWDADGDGLVESSKVHDAGIFPVTLAIERDGTRFRFYASRDDGRTWNFIHELSFAGAKGPLDAGIFAVSDSRTSPTLACFSGFEVRPGRLDGAILAAPRETGPAPEEPQ